MRRLALLAVAAGAALWIGSGTAPAQDLTPQQSRMKSCNAEAGKRELAGDARKGFMSDCLAGKTTPAPGAAAAAAAGDGRTAQQNKMRMCNEEAGAKSLAGDARRAFMSQCLSAKPAATAPAAAASPQETQQNKMRTCNEQASAKNLGGDARRAFMSECLKG